MEQPDQRLSYEVTVGNQGHIEIPQSMLREFGIAVGTRIKLLVDGNPPRIVLVPVTREYIQGFRGILKHTPEGEALQRRRKEESYRGGRKRKGGSHGSKRRPR